MAFMPHQGVRTRLHGENALNLHGEGCAVGILRRALSRSDHPITRTPRVLGAPALLLCACSG